MPADPTPSVNPGFAAKHIAGLLDADPVMARLVKEHVSAERLREVLELPAPEHETLEDAFPDLDRGELKDFVDEWIKENFS